MRTIGDLTGFCTILTRYSPVIPGRSDGRTGVHSAQRSLLIGDLPRVLLVLSDHPHFIHGKSGVTLRRES